MLSPAEGPLYFALWILSIIIICIAAALLGSLIAERILDYRRRRLLKRRNRPTTPNDYSS